MLVIQKMYGTSLTVVKLKLLMIINVVKYWKMLITYVQDFKMFMKIFKMKLFNVPSFVNLAVKWHVTLFTSMKVNSMFHLLVLTMSIVNIVRNNIVMISPCLQVN
ncbi:hypothetical protein B6I74_17150 [Klebsiella variicola]|nr:hypothetical protein B6I74_17150 [Klebsiella variicola]